jgi:hypothetical protein
MYVWAYSASFIDIVVEKDQEKSLQTSPTWSNWILLQKV